MGKKLYVCSNILKFSYKTLQDQRFYYFAISNPKSVSSREVKQNMLNVLKP